jgi:stage II sporulation protein AA (anti-sigma F factor antagonist)
MKVTKEVRGTVALLTCKGEFDSFVCNPFLEEIEHIIAAGVYNIVLNMRLVKFINSTAIGSIIKSRKLLKARAGELAISTPSSFVREVIDNLGLSKVIRVFASDEEAIGYFEPKEEVAVPQENTILVHFADPEKQAVFGKTPGVGKINGLDEDGVLFTVPGPAQVFERGAEVKVKFRLPLYKKAYYFDIPSVIDRVERSPDGNKVRANFTQIFEEDKKSITQFVSDLKLLKEELKNN